MEEDQPALPIILPRGEHTVSRKLIDRDVLWVLNRLRHEGHLAYLVGGAVRDLLLGHEPKDFDIGTDARPSQMRKLFRNCRLIGRRFRLAHVFFRRKGEPEKIVEVSTFRSNRLMEDTGGLDAEDADLSGNEFGPPEEDAWRRDFTVNALFYNLADFTVIDHVGGLGDLERGLIRVIGDPDERFAEDPVRMLRAVEFAVRLGFRIELATAAGMRRNAARIGEASPARLREELRQLQVRGISAETLAEAHRFGLLEPLFPELGEVEGMFPLLELLDERVRCGRILGEAAYVAALSLPTVARRYPVAPGANLDAAQKAIAPTVDALTRRYHIAAHARHLAKELLLSCYRLARGKSYRTKGKFTRRPEFQDALEFFRTWAGITGDLDEVVVYWARYLQGTDGPRKKRRRRPRRRHRRHSPEAPPLPT
jgi:poly(A) polymerase